MADSDKTEKPTAKKKRDTRRKGQIAKSQDLTGWTSLLLGLYLLPMTIGRIVSVPRGGFQALQAASVEPDTATAVESLGTALRNGLFAIAPLLGALALAALVGLGERYRSLLPQQAKQLHVTFGWTLHFPSPRRIEPRLCLLNEPYFLLHIE